MAATDAKKSTETTTTKNPGMSKETILSIITLVTINVMDSIMQAVVGPTFIFYVVQLGGTKEDYGYMLSVASLASLLAIPAYGKWVDSNGNKYTIPYLAGFSAGVISYAMYFFAVLVPEGRWAIWFLGVSRFIDGVSFASRTLAYSWVASAIPHEQQRNVFTVLSMSRTTGTILGPLANVWVQKVRFDLKIFGLTIPVDPNNVIGLLMVGSLVLLTIVTLVFLQEPPEAKPIPKKKQPDAAEGEKRASMTSRQGVLYALSHFEILFPVVTMFVVLCDFMLLVTAFPPVARNIGWNPVEISKVSAYGSAIMAIGMILSMLASMGGAPDLVMISFGIGSFFVSGLGMYYLWTADVGYWAFTIPTYFFYFGYPWIGPANRSRYARAIHSNPNLEGSHGIMMSLINLAAALGSLISPALIASYILRTPSEIEGSLDKHALTPWALYIPVFSVLLLAGLLYNHFFIDVPIREVEKRNSMLADASMASETTTLLPATNNTRKTSAVPRHSILEISDTFSVSSEALRRRSVEINGVPNPFDTKYEMDLNKELRRDQKAWEELQELDDSIEVELRDSA